MTNKDQILREKQQRVNELLIAKTKLERNVAIQRRETEIACAEAKKKAQKEIVTQLEKVLPSTMTGNYPVSARVLAKDIKKIIDEYR